MDKTTATATDNLNDEQIKQYLENRKFLLLSKFLPQQTAGITFWEQLTCVGFNPDVSRLEAVVRIKQPNGYSGGLCSAGSHEFVRFFVDYHDGAGFQDAGFTSFKVADITDHAPFTKHPLHYMVYIFLNDEAHRRFTACDIAVIPTVRAVLSWNSVPSLNPNDIPHFGNVVDVNIQLKRRRIIFWGDLIKELNIKEKLDVLPQVDEAFKLPVIDKPLPPVEQFYKMYKGAGVEDHRTFYTSIIPQLPQVAEIPNTEPAFDLDIISKIGVNIADITKVITNPIFEKDNANITYEQLTCVGLNTQSDTLGAVIKVKKSTGFSGNLCTAGSKEYVAFWADWNDNGIFDEYLGTVSVTVHDVSNVPKDGLYYNVALPLDLSKRLRSCDVPNVVRIRGVLSWQTLPSTTDPNALNFYGNRVDVKVQIRPGTQDGGKVGINLFDVNGVAVSNIDQLAISTRGLAYASAVFPGAAYPFGGLIKLSGMFTNSGPSGTTFYKVQFLDTSGGTWQDVMDKQKFQIIDGSVLTLHDQDPSLTGGWLTYLPAVPFKAEKLSLLAFWDSGSRNGLYKLRVLFTKDPLHAPANISYSSEIYVYLDNTGYTVNGAPSATLDPASTLDVIIAGGDCKFYKKGDVINGQLKATDQFFSQWYFDLQPAAHIIPPGTPLSTIINPSSRSCVSLVDNGNNGLAFTIDTKYLQSCGYTIRLSATDRSLVGYKITFLDGSYIYNITSHYAEKYLGFAVLP
ncbi:hypothetical protein [Chitinophaga ginsengisoli]|uniref:Uncharacterized protein n=1 Tax=Chitinophaga ginsengisoli TaxID=363837 RepID=A0A2P8FXA4_9BACT|nr:hypothetical protein [Chitinophaga ginsengisoli]PSL26349.1 hypothetical protein CLV42_11160 [Chitinophaga ginsengisoli]